MPSLVKDLLRDEHMRLKLTLTLGVEVMYVGLIIPIRAITHVFLIQVFACGIMDQLHIDGEMWKHI